MSTDSATDPFEMDDAAYVLGALQGAERAAFEVHLRTCADCTGRVAELRGVSALLSGITEADFVETESDANAQRVPDTLLPALLRAARTERRHRRGLVAGLASLAAACALALTLVLVWPTGHAHSAPVAMTAFRASPVRATAQLDSVEWGTAITLVCHYAGTYATGTEYSLVVVRKDGRSEVAGSWDLSPGEATTFRSGIAWPKSEISKVEIVSGGTELLQLQR